MFSRTNNAPQRDKFCFTTKQIKEDIDLVYRDEVQRSLLYNALDNVSPKENHFEKIEEFLKGTQDLEHSANTLENLKHKTGQLELEVAAQIETLNNMLANAK